MARFTDLPQEILEHIGCILSTYASITPLILVSRWSHHHLQHLFWRRITITPDTPLAFAATLKDHAHLVCSLRFQDAVPQEYYQIHFPQLVIFQLDNSSHFSRSREICRYCEGFFRLNRTIQDIIMHPKHLFLNRRFWDAIYISLRNPKRLKLGGGGFRAWMFPLPWEVSGAAFWRAWDRFEEIEYSDGVVQHSSSFTEGAVGAKSFSYKAKDNVSGKASGLWAWATRCSNLTRLRWGALNLNGYEEPAVTEGPIWPHLEDFSLRYVSGSDEEIARGLFCRLPSLKNLRLDGGFFGQLCFDTLRERHFGSLKSLFLGYACGFSGEMAFKILQECTNLEVLVIEGLCLEDFRSTSPGVWACLGLKCLRVSFESEPADIEDPEADMLLFEQLSRLTSLQELEMRRYAEHPVDFTKVPILRLRLDSGLALLSTLTRLVVVNVTETDQEMQSEDVEWMLEHWPLLKQLRGQLSSDACTEDRLVRLLVDREVTCERYVYQPDNEYEGLGDLISLHE